jgi:Xaa-Pro aminopeptidase
VCLLPSYWPRFLKSAEGVKTVDSILSKCVLKGWEAARVGEYEAEVIARAVQFLRDLGYDVPVEKVIIADNKNTEAPLGQMVEDKLYINSKAIRAGFDITLDALTEELFHYTSRSGDCTREFQNFIMKELMHQMKRLHMYLKKEE